MTVIFGTMSSSTSPSRDPQTSSFGKRVGSELDQHVPLGLSLSISQASFLKSQQARVCSLFMPFWDVQKTNHERLIVTVLQKGTVTVLRIEGTNVTYKTGDSLAVWPRNPFDKVEANLTLWRSQLP